MDGGAPAGWPEGVGRLILPEAGSTNDEARRRAAAGEPGPLWIMARRQTAGRGRRGRVWTAPEGNLNATLLMRPGCAPREAALRSFVACLAAAEMLAALAPAAEVALKWPNDVLIGGGKVAGVLLESEGAAGGETAWLAVGIGVNLAAAPPDDGQGTVRPASLAEAAAIAPPPPEDALTLLAAAFARHDARLAAEGFAPLRAAWLARAAGLGRPATARLPNETVTGVIADLDADGALVMDTPTGPRRIHAADVHLG